MRSARHLAAAIFAVLPFLHSYDAAAVTCTWQGTVSASWSAAANWDAGCPLGPANGDTLVFPDGGSNKAMIDDIADLSVASISFTGAGGGYSITGNGNLTISDGVAITSLAKGGSANTIALTNPLKFGAAVATIDTSAGGHGVLNLNGPIDLDGKTLHFVWDSFVSSTIVNGVVSGAGALTTGGVGGNTGLLLNGSNTFTGPVDVNTGYLAVYNTSALGATGAGNATTVHGGGTFVVGADISGEMLTLQGGSGTSGNGVLQLDGSRTWSGPVSLGNDTGVTNFFNLLSNAITFTGTVTGPGGIQCCNGLTGMVTLTNAGNTYSGPTNFDRGGILRAGAADALSHNSAVMVVAPNATKLDLQGFSATIAGLTGNAQATLRMTAGQTLTVTGSVALNDMTLDLLVPFAPALGTVFTIIDKPPVGAVTGIFSGLAEGANAVFGGTDMTISYAGGDGNDVTLTVVPPGGFFALAVQKPGSGSGVVKSDVGLIDCGAVCIDAYQSGSTVDLTAAPDVGSVFMGWLGPCTGTGDCKVEVTQATTVRAYFAPDPGSKLLDVDGNGSYDALTDGVLVERYLSGFSSATFVTSAIGPGAARSSSGQVKAFLDDVVPMLDVDGNGTADAATDGLLIVRYLLGLRGDDLIVDALGTGASRTTSGEIETYIQSLMP